MKNEFSAMPLPAPQRRPVMNIVSYLEPKERGWAKAPITVQFARKIAVGSVFFYSFLSAYFVGDIVSKEHAIVTVSFYQFLLLALTVILALVNLWLVGGLKKGQPLAWGVQRTLSLASLLLFPLGTLLHLPLLLQWVRFESKVWFTTC